MHSRPQTNFQVGSPRSSLSIPDEITRELKEVAELGLSIIKAAQGAQCSTQRLAQSVGTVVCATLRRHAADAKAADGVPSDLLEELMKTLSSIKCFVQKRASQNAFMRLVKHMVYLKKIKGYRDNLERILGKFRPASTVLTEQTLEQMASQLENTLEELAFREQEDQASLHNEPYGVPTISTANPFHAYPNTSPSYIYTRERYVETTVGGNRTIVDASSHVTSFNSGNSTMTIITDSNNRR